MWYDWSTCTDCFKLYNDDEIYGGMYVFDKDSTDGEITPSLYGSDDFLCMDCICKREDNNKENNNAK
mgnify:CR=1 FL=1